MHKKIFIVLSSHRLHELPLRKQSIEHGWWLWQWDKSKSLDTVASEMGVREVHNLEVESGSAWSEICPSATLSTTNPSWLTVGFNPGLCTENMSADYQSYSMAEVVFILIF